MAIAACFAGSAFEALLGGIPSNEEKLRTASLIEGVGANGAGSALVGPGARAPKRAKLTVRVRSSPPDGFSNGAVGSSGRGVGVVSAVVTPSPSASPKSPLRGSPVDGKLHRPLMDGCRTVDRFRKLNRIDEGTYGVVYRARDTETDNIVALKQLKLNAAKSDEGFPIASLREINILTRLDHPHVVKLHEVVMGSSQHHIFMVFEYAEHELKTLLERHDFSVAEVKCLLRQLLEGVEYLHDSWVIHRDLKTSNVLLNNKGVLKVCDFGLARHYGEPSRKYTKTVVTLWYRAPELLLGLRAYTTKVDIWSVGCILAEMFLKRPLFCGKAELHQLSLIYQLTGVPTEETWPGYDSLPNRKSFDFKLSMPTWRMVLPEVGDLSDAGLELLRCMLTCCPSRRATAADAADHPYFDERPLPQDPSLMPSFHETNSVGRAKRCFRSPPPPGGAGLLQE